MLSPNNLQSVCAHAHTHTRTHNPRTLNPAVLRDLWCSTGFSCMERRVVCNSPTTYTPRLLHMVSWSLTSFQGSEFGKAHFLASHGGRGCFASVAYCQVAFAFDNCTEGRTLPSWRLLSLAAWCICVNMASCFLVPDGVHKPLSKQSQHMPTFSKSPESETRPLGCSLSNLVTATYKLRYPGQVT